MTPRFLFAWGDGGVVSKEGFCVRNGWNLGDILVEVQGGGWV